MNLTEEPPVLDYDPGLVYMWKVKPSEQEGYYRTYYMDTPEGDHLEVDFNNVRNMVRISLKPEREAGREYVAIIKSGTIIRERDVTSARPMDLTSRILPLIEKFGFIREDQVLRAIGGNYGIPLSPTAINLPRIYRETSLDPRNLRLLDKLRNYIDEKRKEEAKPRTLAQRFFRRLPAEFIDLSLGFMLFGAYYWQYLNLTELAGFVGFLGIMSGAVDWIWRQRDPFLPKVLSLLALSFGAVCYQMQYRLWGLFLP